MPEQKSAILVAAFGTGDPSAVGALLALVRDIAAAYPRLPARLAFRAESIRDCWRRRAADRDFRASHPELPEPLYQVQNVHGALAELRAQGCRSIVIQPIQLTAGSGYLALKADLDRRSAPGQEQPQFDRLALGSPLLGSCPAQHPDPDAAGRLAAALAEDVRLAERQQAALLYVGHGAAQPANGCYGEFERQMNRSYPQVKSFVGLLEGGPDFAAVLEKVQAGRIRKVLLKPLLLVAGHHLSREIAGAETCSWKSRLAAAGVETLLLPRGLAQAAPVRQLFINQLQQTAERAGIELG